MENARIKEVLRLRKARERRAAGLFVAEGTREVERALRAGLVANALYVASELLPAWAPERVAEPPRRPDKAPGVPADWTPETDTAARRFPALEEVSARVLAKMAYRVEPEGVLGVFEIPQRGLPTDADLILVAVEIEKPGNLGAMARTADAAGADALLVVGTASDPWNPNAIRASTGAVFTLPIIGATLDDVRALAHRKVAAVVGAPTPYTATDLTQPTALIVGAEDEGLDAHWREAADVHVSIPMRARSADSLNAATSAALLLYEAVRQRG